MVTSTFVLLKHKREMSSSFMHLLSVHNAPVRSSYMISFYPQHNGSRCHSRPYSPLPINFSTLDLAMGLDLRSWGIGSTLLYVLGALRPPSHAQAWARPQDGGHVGQRLTGSPNTRSFRTSHLSPSHFTDEMSKAQRDHAAVMSIHSLGSVVSDPLADTPTPTVPHTAHVTPSPLTPRPCPAGPLFPASPPWAVRMFPLPLSLMPARSGRTAQLGRSHC